METQALKLSLKGQSREHFHLGPTLSFLSLRECNSSPGTESVTVHYVSGSKCEKVLFICFSSSSLNTCVWRSMPLRPPPTHPSITATYQVCQSRRLVFPPHFIPPLINQPPHSSCLPLPVALFLLRGFTNNISIFSQKWRHFSFFCRPGIIDTQSVQYVLPENVSERQTDGLSLSLWRDLKDQRGWKGSGGWRDVGGVRIVTMATMTSLKRACALCLNGSFVCAEVKANNSPGSDRRRHFVRSECQNGCSLSARRYPGCYTFFFLFFSAPSSFPSLCIPLRGRLL